MNAPATDRVRFGIFEFDRLNRLLYRDGQELALPPRAVGVLACLLDRGGQVVSKQDLLDGVWKEANVTETSLAEAVSLLRQTLGDDSQRPTFIQTLPRRGYRFVHPLASGGRTTGGETNGSGSGSGNESHATAASDDDVEQTPPLAARAGHVADLTQVAGADAAASPAFSRDTRSDADDAAGDGEPVWPIWMPWVLLGAMSIALGMVLLTSAREPSRAVRPVTRFTLTLPADLTLATSAPAIALSNDGRRLAFVATRPGDPARLFVRDLDRLEPAVLAGTEGAAAPFFSPDGQWIGFFAQGQLRKTPIGGGTAQTICLAPHPFGATWTPDGSIIFASSWTGGLQQVDDAGGEPVTLTEPDMAIGETRHAWPDLLPDGRGVLFASLSGGDAPETARVSVLSLPQRRIRPLLDAATFPRFVSTGHLLFTRGDTVFAALFDPSALDLLGQAAPVLDGVRAAGTHGATQLAVTRAGNLVLASAEGSDTADDLRLFDTTPPASPLTASLADAPKSGTPAHDPTATNSAPALDGSRADARGSRSLGWPFPARLLRSLALSADGSRVAASLGDGHRADIWVSALPNGAPTRLTSTGQNVTPQWTPDGRVIFSARRDEAFNLFVKQPDDDAAAMRLTHASANQFVTSAASPAGAVFVESQPRTGLDLWLLPWDGGAARPVARTSRDETAGALSPDGRWLAYQIGDGGTWRVVVRALDRGEDEPKALAEGDGTLTAWAADGRALLFVRDGRLLRLPLIDAAHAAGPAIALSDAARESDGYALSAAGRGLAAARRGMTARPHLEVVLEWARELSLKVPVLPPAMKSVR